MIKLFERYENHDNIKKLADLIIMAIANRTIKYDKWNKGDKDIYQSSPSTMMGMILPVVLADIDVKGKGFTREFRNFIKDKKQHFRVLAETMGKNSRTKGAYFPDNLDTYKKRVRIELYYDKDSIDNYFYDTLDSNISNMNRYNLHKFLNLRKNTLEHELQHAFDDYRSKGKFNKGTVLLPSDVNSPNYISKYKDYVNSSHEISAFFTNTASKVLDVSYKNKSKWYADSYYDPSNWDKVSNAFKSEFPSWDSVDTNVQKKLMKRLYQLYSTMYPSKIKGKDIKDKVKSLEKYLINKYNTDKIMLWYNHDHNYIIIDEMYANSEEDEESILKEILKLADTYKKIVGINLYKKHTSIYLTKSRKLLRSLGFFDNYKSNKRDYRFREEWIRYSKRK